MPRPLQRARLARWLAALSALVLIPLAGVFVGHSKASAACANPVACENQLPGTPQSTWDVSGSGDPTIQGFATDISVNHGSTISFKIDTNAPKYKIDIYRIGYYQGNGARYITSITPSAKLPQSQPACLFDSTTELTDCGNWAVSASWAVPSTAVSGVYIAKLTRTDTGGASQIIFIVRADESHSSIYYQTSDATWEAYNRYGGYSLYYGSPNRAYKVSYNRPFITRDCCDETFFFSAEYPMIRWMEMNGYDISYATDVDTDRYGSLLLNHKVFMSSGHDEYWSANQRANVEAARAAGVDLAFFSGNESYWKTRWEPSIDPSATSYRTLVSYKETYASAPIDPQDPPTWTGTWRDPRFSPPADGGRPENEMSGQLFMVNCCDSSADQNFSITVPQSYSDLRIWRNTAIASLPPGGVYTFPAGTLGYEWDEDVDNGSRPAGEIDMSSTTESVSQLLQDYGNTFAPGTATHHLTEYRASSGALVFGAGTIRWSWGLDSTHDSATSVVDPNMQQATVNIFADMGVQPATLQSNLVFTTSSTDTTPPASTITSPVTGATVIADQPTTISGTAADSGGGVVAGVEVSTDGGSTWHPATGTTNWSYTWQPHNIGPTTIKVRATDDSLNTEAPGAGTSVNVIRVCPCTAWPASAAPGTAASGNTTPDEVGVKLRFDVSGTVSGIRFYKGSTNTGTHVGDLWTGSGTPLATATFTNETATGWQQVNFSTPVPVAANTTYVASYYVPTGHFAQDFNYFTNSGQNSTPVHALQAGVDGADGVYHYNGSGFPNLAGYQNSNYWVDVVFNANPTAAPTGVTATAASATQVNVSWSDVSGENGFQVQRSPDGSTWTTIARPAQGVTSYADTGLLPSTLYYYRVLAVDSGGSSPPSTTVSALTASAVPPAPTGVIATGTSGTTVSVSWTNVATATSYQVQRSTDGQTWSTAGATPAAFPRFGDSGLSPTTVYYYRIIAVNNSGPSQPSATVSVTTLSATPVPGAPSGLVASAVSATQVQLTWNDVTGEAGFTVQRSSDGTNWNSIDTVPAGTTTYVDANDVTSATTFFYRVIATNSGGSSSPSNVVSVTTLANPPAAPSTVLASPVSTSSISVSWKDVTGETGFLVQRSMTGTSNWSTAGTTGAGVLSFTDTGLAGSTTYYYRVESLNAGGYSLPSATATATTLLAPPAAPGGVRASAVSQTEIDVSWSDVANETGFTVQRSADGATNWSNEGSTAQGVLVFQDTGLTANTLWYYRVIAVNSAGSSSPSAVVSATSLPNPPTAPTKPAAKPLSASQIQVTWSDVPGETGFSVLRSATGTSGWTTVGTVGQGVTTYTDSGLSPATTYYYEIVATNAGGSSPPSPVVKALTAPVAPTNLAATSPTPNEIDPSWSDVTGENGFQLYISSTGTGSWSPSCKTPKGVLTCKVGGLVAATTYYFYVTALSPSIPSAPSSIISATTRSLAKAPAAPTGLTAATLSASSIGLSWNDVTGETGFTVQRSPDGSTSWVTIGTTAQAVTTYTDTGLAASTTYYYRVLATSAGGTSDPSATASATTLSVTPAAPSGVTVQPLSSNSLLVQWGDVAGETGFVLKRSTSSSGPWSTAATLGPGVTSYTDSGLAASTTYYYEVIATNSGGSSPPSATAQGTTDPTAPGAPGTPSAQALSSSSIQVSWPDVQGETGFAVLRSPNGTSSWTTVGTTAQGVLSYTDTGLAASTTYFYEVEAQNSGGLSSPSPATSAITFPLPPAAPTGLAATSASYSAISLAWSDVAGETGFTIQRSTNGTTGWVVAGTTGQAVTSYTDSGLSTSTTYYYEVIATNAGGSSPPSSTVSATTLPPPPPAPTGVTARAASAYSIQVTWSDVSGETGFSVQRSPDGSTSWATVGTTGQAVTSFLDGNLAPTTTYYYRVLANSSSGSSAPSAVVSATTPQAPPATPSGVAAAPVSSSSIQVTWSAAAGATSYTVQRSPTGTGSWTTAGTPATTSFTDSGLTANTIYYYEVIANGNGGSSAPSAPASAATYPTPPSAPSGLVATPVSTSQINLSWNDVPGETGFAVQRSANGSTGWSTVATTGIGVTTYSDTGLTVNTTYYYQVLATNAGGSSPPSAVASAATTALAPTAPGSPRAVSLSSSSISVAWVDTTAGNPSDTASGFTVQRSTSGTGSWATIATLPQSSSSYIDSGLTANTTYYYQVIASNSAGSSPASSVVGATTDVTLCPCSIWASTATPSVAASADTSANELGVKFRTDVAGYITAIRFYKGSTNTGTHVGHLWTSTGTLLASATFTNETASGWQQVTFSAPVAVSPNTTYVASYYAPSGHYSQDVGYFTSTGADNAPLHGLQAGVDGANGVYRYGSSGFPSLAGYSSSNYWVDVVFTQNVPPAPTGLSASSVTANQVMLAWGTAANATGYKVDRSPDGSNWTTVGSTTAGTTTFTDTALSPSTLYYYRVRAVDYGGSSPPSSSLPVTTSSS